MSIRIHALAKELNVTSKELIDFINRRQDKYGLEIKTPSNAIAPIYAEAITNDFPQCENPPKPLQTRRLRQKSRNLRLKPRNRKKSLNLRKMWNAKKRRKPKQQKSGRQSRRRFEGKTGC